MFFFCFQFNTVARKLADRVDHPENPSQAAAKPHRNSPASDTNKAEPKRHTMHFVGQRNQESESAGLQRRSLDIKYSDRLADALDRSSSSGYVSSESTSSQVNNECNSGLCNLFLGSLSNDDGDGRENVKKPIGLGFLCMCNALFFVHFFAVTSRLRRENAQFDGLWRTWTQDNFLFLFLNFDTVFLELNSRSICQHLINWKRWNKHDKVWSSTNSILKVTFSLKSSSLLLKLLIKLQVQL